MGIKVVHLQCNQWLFQKTRTNIDFTKASERRFANKFKNLELINKELEFKVKFYEDRNKELTEEIKDCRVVKTTDSEKIKIDKKRLLKRCKGLEAAVKLQEKEIDILKKKLDGKNKQIKNYEIESESFKMTIKKFKSDIEEFKRTNAILSEAQQKDVDIENRQQQHKILKLQNYIRELHKNINK